MDLIPSLKKDGKLAAFNGFLYREDKVFTKTISWRCTQAGCKGRLGTGVDMEPVERGAHSHPPDPARIDKKRVHVTVSTEAERSHDPPRRIVQDAVQNLTEEAAVKVRYEL
jgi:hypothetical protein